MAEKITTRAAGQLMASPFIERVDRWLAANRPDYYARLQPGATDAAPDCFESRFVLRLPQPFRAF